MSAITSLRAHRGFTIVEMMVALLLATILSMGAVTMFSSAGRADRTQTIIASLNDSGRFAIDTIARDLRMAGWREANWTSGAITNAIVGVNGDPAAGGDTLTIRYEAARDCTFTAPPLGVVVNTYTVVSNEFRCNGQAIVAGIEQMQVYFGEDTDHDGVANRLVAPGSAGLDMTRVVSVRVHLLANTVADNVALSSQGYFFDSAVQPAVNDGHIRREYSITVALRNPM